DERLLRGSLGDRRRPVDVIARHLVMHGDVVAEHDLADTPPGCLVDDGAERRHDGPAPPVLFRKAWISRAVFRGRPGTDSSSSALAAGTAGGGAETTGG